MRIFLNPVNIRKECSSIKFFYSMYNTPQEKILSMHCDMLFVQQKIRFLQYFVIDMRDR